MARWKTLTCTHSLRLHVSPLIKRTGYSWLQVSVSVSLSHASTFTSFFRLCFHRSLIKGQHDKGCTRSKLYLPLNCWRSWPRYNIYMLNQSSQAEHNLVYQCIKLLFIYTTALNVIIKMICLESNSCQPIRQTLLAGNKSPGKNVSVFCKTFCCHFHGPTLQALPKYLSWFLQFLQTCK